jgi:hypothetical protein
MDARPPIDASRPSGLRLAGFALAIGGALLMGVGATRTWVTVGIEGLDPTNTVIPGIDLPDGKIVLGAAAVLLVATLAGRLVRDRSLRMGLAALAIAAGAIGAATAGAFLSGGLDRQVVVGAIGIPRDQWETLGVIREFGPGPMLALTGGVLGFVSGVLTLAWAQRLSGGTEAETYAGGPPA